MITLLISCKIVAQGVQTEVPKGSTTAAFGYLEYLPANYSSTPNKTIPTIIFFHGVGERGNGTTDLDKVDDHGIPREIRLGNWPILNQDGNPPDEDFIVISPQTSSGFPSASQIYDFIEYVKSSYKADPDRIYLTGMSAGGISTWRYLATYSGQIAAALPVCGHANGYLDQLCNSKEIPVWAFHGDSDNVVGVSGSINAINELQNCSPSGAGPHLLTIFNGVKHNSWRKTYDLGYMNSSIVDSNYDPYDMSIYDWFLLYRRGVQILVTLDSDQTITLPTNSIILKSTITSTNSITNYSWVKQSGPAATLVNASTSTLTVNGMLEGTYTFRLTVTDNQGNKANDEVSVTVLPEVVNQAPVANAGVDQTVALPTNLTVFNGSGSDSDGSITSYSWTKLSGPSVTMQNQNTASLTVLGLVEGSYRFRLTVTDDDGATSSDDVDLIVEAANVGPTVNAGVDQTIQLPTNTIVLNGSASDSDGSIASLQWSKQSGPSATLQNATTTSLTAKDLLQGTYVFRLAATDDDGAVKYDEVKVIVQATNQAPVANAGSDQNLKLPVSSSTISGSGTDNDGSVVSYEWTQVSGPSVTMTNVNSATLSISDLLEGSYIFGLRVTDDDGSTGYDEVVVTVDAANVTPVANAGDDIVIFLPTNTTTISGIGSDADGTIASYEWLKKSGPTATVTNKNTSTITLSDLVEGSYTFTFRVTDNEGASASDEVKVYVLISNDPPTANAGGNQTITLPTNSINLTGSGSDNDGSVISYTWNKISGPSATLTNESTATLQLTDLLEGTYVFALTVKDDEGATGYDEATIVVLPEPVNNPPLVNASDDIVITLPTSSVDLSSTSNDTDGSIISYLWEKVSGPSAVINSANSSNTLVSGLVAGSYVFRITVTDDDGAAATDDINITVYEESINQNPEVDAGSTINIRLPENSLTFSPVVSDDGTIVSYEWSQISGPNSASFDDATIEKPFISGLVVGTYRFRLKVIDDLGASSSDEITVNVNDFNQPPTVNAGKDIIIQLPDNFVQITANASDADGGSIVSYQWTRISGPNGETISGANIATANITELSQGVYVFQVEVTDNEGAIATDQIKVTVQAENVIPTANAGNNIEIRLPINSINIKGSGSDADGTIVSHEWSKESGPMITLINTNTATLTLNDLLVGNYTLRLTVTDDDGASNFDDVQLIVLPELSNSLPSADAGPDQQITLPTKTTSFKGSGSDKDGSIVEYNWIKLSGPASSLSNENTSTLTVSDLIEGIYIFRLTVTDDEGATDSDDVKLIVRPELINQNPTANAGPDHNITLPTESLNINGSGSDADGSVVKYYWEKIAGPAVSMSNSNNSVLVLGNLLEGTYKFKLTVTDDDGATSSDIVTVVVNSQDINQEPIANAGQNISIVLPTNTVILNGSGSDSDGSIESYSWQKINGPSATITNNDNATLTVTDLIEGIYVFRLTVTDDDGSTGTDETRIIVVNANVNSNPTVLAGDDVIIHLPTNSAILRAVASDRDGSIVNYQWEQISGEKTNMSDPGLATLMITDLEIGTYSYRVTVTDNNGSTDYDEVKVIVEPNDVNIAPSADAGQDVQIVLPTNSVNMTGTGSDNDGSIISYQWIKISGPAVTISNPDKPTASFTEMVEGEYTFRFTVTDNDGGTGQDELKIYVIPEVINQAPTANAGEDIELFFPTDNVNIFGGGNDIDGEIISYAWEKISGPTATIVSADKATLELSDLEVGIYEFRLIVIDNENASGSDYVTIIVKSEGSNQLPSVDLGENIFENLPLDSLVIKGYVDDPDGNIVNYSWSKISGASVILEENGSTLTIKNLSAGTYIFRLAVQDNNGATAFDDIIITIYPEGVNRSPESDAGPDIHVSLPENSVTIYGGGSDPDGDKISFEWSQVAGPTVHALEGIDNAELHLLELVAGTYVFELLVFDTKGASSSDQVTIVVKPENIPPIADAGEDIVLSFPVEDNIHIGIGEDEDGYIISYQWRLVEGPAINNFLVYSDTLKLSGLESGDYIYELSVMDNDSLIATDEILIRVSAGELSGLGAHKVFSPDGNGIDDYWEIDNLEMISGCQLTIFNRFGLLVYESNNYQNEWDGTYNGSPLPDGDYYYIIRCGNDSKAVSGGIRIIRDY